MTTISMGERPLETAAGQAWLRTGAICAVAGCFLGFAATLAHPKEFVAYDSAAHLQTIAAAGIWVLDHFLFVVATFLILFGLMAVADALAQTPGARLAKWASLAAMIGTATAAAFFAVDGFGMKVAAALWLSAPPAEATMALYSGLLMAKLGIATASVYMLWYLGLMPILYGAAMLQSGAFPRWVGWLAGAGGVVGFLAGAGFYIAGFSAVGTVGFILSQTVFFIWPAGAGMALMRRARA
jgi:hypothetical protein